MSDRKLFQAHECSKNVRSDRNLSSEPYERSKKLFWAITSWVPRSMSDQKTFYERSQAQLQALWAIKNFFMSDHKICSKVYERSENFYERSQAQFQALWAIKRNFMSDQNFFYERSQDLFQGLWAIRDFFMSDHKLSSKPYERSKFFLWAITKSVPRSMSDHKLSSKVYERSQANSYYPSFPRFHITHVENSYSAIYRLAQECRILITKNISCECS